MFYIQLSYITLWSSLWNHVPPSSCVSRSYRDQLEYNSLSIEIILLYFQIFIFITVTSFGPLPCSIITTTRKFFTILGSVIIFQNPINSRQWAGTIFVFMGLGLDSVYGKEKKTVKAKAER